MPVSFIEAQIDGLVSLLRLVDKLVKFQTELARLDLPVGIGFVKLDKQDKHVEAE